MSYQLPTSLSPSITGLSVAPESAAALPLTTLTAWEMLFDRLDVPVDESPATLLVIGGAGGVGSITTQLASCHNTMSLRRIVRTSVWSRLNAASTVAPSLCAASRLASISSIWCC